MDNKIENLTASDESSRTKGETSDILTVDEAAALLRVNRKTLYEVIRLNHPRWAIRFGRSIRVSRTALLEEFRGKGSPALGDQQ
jgi:excisionase family DNA binding protein